MTQTSPTVSVEQPVPTKKATGPTSVPKSKSNATVMSKTDIVLRKLRGAKGVSIQQLVDATGWQAHSVRGFLSASVRKKFGLNLVSDIGKDTVRRYRIVDEAESGS